MVSKEEGDFSRDSLASMKSKGASSLFSRENSMRGSFRLATEDSINFNMEDDGTKSWREEYHTHSLSSVINNPKTNILSTIYNFINTSVGDNAYTPKISENILGKSSFLPKILHSDFYHYLNSIHAVEEKYFLILGFRIIGISIITMINLKRKQKTPRKFTRKN